MAKSVKRLFRTQLAPIYPESHILQMALQSTLRIWPERSANKKCLQYLKKKQTFC